MMATTTSTAHVRKRQFQPSIDSYFNSRDAGDFRPSPSARTAPSLLLPLPSETQASLLNVGMRVRKSVPEGYKTHKTIPAGHLFPSTAPTLLPTTPPFRNRDANLRELTPFCGLHKTGGLAAQESPSSSAPATIHLGHEELDVMPDMTMSQYTLASTQASFDSSMSAFSFSTRKRVYEEEIEDDLDAYFDGLDNDGDSDENRIVYLRPIARLKGSARPAETSVPAPFPGNNDFDDVHFLAPPERMDLDGV